MALYFSGVASYIHYLKIWMLLSRDIATTCHDMMYSYFVLGCDIDNIVALK